MYHQAFRVLLCYICPLHFVACFHFLSSFHSRHIFIWIGPVWVWCDDDLSLSLTIPCLLSVHVWTLHFGCYIMLFRMLHYAISDVTFRYFGFYIPVKECLVSISVFGLINFLSLEFCTRQIIPSIFQSQSSNIHW